MIWNRVSLLVIITHECVIITKELHEVPYHMVNTWNEVVKPFLYREFVSVY